MGGVDPLLQPKWWDNPDLVREVTAIRSYRYFTTVNPTTDLWTEYEFIDMGRTDYNFESSRVLITNDGAETIEFSFDGVTVHGILYSSEAKVDDERRERHIYVRNAIPGNVSAVRIWAW
jgi:hypothetical protein